MAAKSSAVKTPYVVREGASAQNTAHGFELGYSGDGAKLVIEVDLDSDLGPSASGKSVLMASSRGTVRIPALDGGELSISLNVFRPVASRAAAPAAPVAAPVARVAVAQQPITPPAPKAVAAGKLSPEERLARMERMMTAMLDKMSGSNEPDADEPEPVAVVAETPKKRGRPSNASKAAAAVAQPEPNRVCPF